MKNNSAKRIAFKTLLKNKLYSLPDCSELERIIESNDFIIINYKKHTNSKDVCELIKKLGIENEIECNDSFLYVKNNLRFVFLNEDVCAEDRRALLCHELGHILDPEIRNHSVNYSKIKKEEFANEFSCYIKNPPLSCRFYLFMIKKRRFLLSIIILITCLLGFLLSKSLTHHKMTNSVARQISIPANSDSAYYVTMNGKRYHRNSCIIVKTRKNLTEYTLEDAISDGYTPCLICLPEE